MFDDDTAARDDFLGELNLPMAGTELQHISRNLTGRRGVGESRGSVVVWVGEPGEEPAEEAAPMSSMMTLSLVGATGLR